MKSRPLKYQYVVPKDVRTIIFRSSYWRDDCRGLTMESLADKAEKLDHLGGVFAEEPTSFICLVLKMLMIKPEPEMVSDMMSRTPHRYLLAVGAMFLRLTGDDFHVYSELEPFFFDYRELKLKTGTGTFIWSHVDVFIEELLWKDNVCSIPLPRLKKRWIFEAIGLLGPRRRHPEIDVEFKDTVKMAQIDSASGNEKETYRQDKSQETYRQDKSQSESIAIGIKTGEGVIIVAEKTKCITPPLLEHFCLGKIMLIDEHVGCAMSGSIVVARIQVQCLQFQSQHYRYTDGEPAPIEALTDAIALLAPHLNKMPGADEMFFLVGGIDEDGPNLFHIDSSGDYQAYDAKAIGAHSEDADRSLKKLFKEDLTLKEAEMVAVSILKQFMEREFTSTNIAIAKISPIYHLYSTVEVQAVINLLK